MSEQQSEELSTEPELTPDELFEQAINSLENPDEPIVEDPPEEVNYDHDPTPDDDEDYWKGFAQSKGWKDDPTSVKPGHWTDYRAFINNYGTIQASKSAKAQSSDLERKLENLAKSQAKVAKTLEAQHKREIEQVRSELEGRKKKAEDEEDLAAYKQADEKIKELDATTETATDESPPEPQELEVFVNFRNANPELLKGSDAFDPILNTAVEAEVNKAIQNGEITDASDLPAFMEGKLSELKSRFVAYQEPPARTPPGTNKVARTASTKASVADLSSEQRQWYNHFKENGMKDEAEAFLRESLGVKQ